LHPNKARVFGLSQKTFANPLILAYITPRANMKAEIIKGVAGLFVAQAAVIAVLVKLLKTFSYRNNIYFQEVI
jgi:hypothetical protein